VIAASRIGLASAILAVTAAHAQSWRTIDASRQLRDTLPVSVRLEYAAGRLEVRPSSGPSLYQMNLKYDADRAAPITRYDSATRSVAIGIRSHGMRVSGGQADGGSLHAELSNRVPMELALELGAVEGDIQLGGLRLTDLSVKSGAADVSVRFDQPNPDRLHSLTLEVGAANLKLDRAGNSGVERVRANIGVGALELDLGGALTHDVDIGASVAMGGFTLRVPADVGVFVDASTFLASFDKTGMEKRGDGWYTPGFDQAKRHVRVRVKAFLGDFTLLRNAR
jgi:hypothetical protein